MRSIVLIALLISYVLSASYTFNGNVTIDNVAEFKYRSLLDLPDILGLSSYLSVSVDAQANNNGGTAALDVVAGGVLFNPVFKPTTFLGFTYITATAYTDVLTGKSNATFDASGSFLLTSYLNIVEKDSTGKEVRNLNLKGLLWSASKTRNEDLLTYSISASNLNVIGGSLKSGESLTFDFITAAKLGVVPVGTQNINVSPKTLESIVRINNWQYVSASNTLTLRVGAVTGSANAQGTANSQVIGTGNKQVYIQFADSAEINGAPGSVKITKSSSAVADLADYGTWVAQANAVYSGSLTGNIFEVMFTPGASSIVYDPTMGSGNMMQKSSASAVFVTLLALIIALLA